MVIREKGESQNGGKKKAKRAKFSKKRTFITPWYAHERMWFEIWTFWDVPFWPITDELLDRWEDSLHLPCTYNPSSTVSLLLHLQYHQRCKPKILKMVNLFCGNHVVITCWMKLVMISANTWKKQQSLFFPRRIY